MRRPGSVEHPATYWRAFSEELGVDATTPLFGAAAFPPATLQEGLAMPSSSPPVLPTAALSQTQAEGGRGHLRLHAGRAGAGSGSFPRSLCLHHPAAPIREEEDQASVAMWNYAIAHQDMPESPRL